MTVTDTDVIDTLVGVVPGSPLDGVRRERADTRTYAQASYDALFTATASGVTRAERLAVATFLATLNAHPAGVEHYGSLLEAENSALAAGVAAVARLSQTSGPYGRYPETTVLQDENIDGLRYVVDADDRAALGERLAVALEHVHLLVFRPRESTADALTGLAAAGWTPTEIVTLTQLVGFLSFQLRVVTGLRALQELISDDK